MYDVCTSSYTAKQADTCVSISLQNNLPVSQLQSLNPKLYVQLPPHLRPTCELSLNLCIRNCSSTDLSGSSICLFYNTQPNLGACTARHSVVSGDICYNESNLSTHIILSSRLLLVAYSLIIIVMEQRRVD